MMLRFLFIVCWMLASAQTAPTTAPSQSLLQGAIVYTPPVDWNFLGKRNDDRSAGYSAPQHLAQIVIVIAPQEQTVPDELGPKLALQIGQTIRAEAAKGNIEIVSQPKVEPDKRFLLKIHDQFKTKGKFSDRTLLYRGIGRNLVSLTVNAFSENPDEQKQIVETAESMMLSVALDHPASEKRAGATTKPVVLTAAHLRVSPPVGWTAESTGQASGLIVTWRDPVDASNFIALTFRSIPPQSGDDPQLTGFAIEQIAAGEKPVFNVEGAQMIGQLQTISDKRFLKKTRAEYQVKESKLSVTFRQLRVGDGVASITSVSVNDKMDEVDAMADQVATNVRAMR